MLKQHPMDIKTSFVATDYTCSPSTEQSDLDLYFIPHKILKYDYEHPNIPLSKMVCSGIPIRQMFYHNTSKEEAKKALGIPTNQPHLLLMCGSMGCGPIKHLVRLLSREEGFQMTVVCGTNDKLQKSLQKHYKAHSNIHIRGYEKDMSLLLDSADLYLTKPGGLSVTESVAKNLPLVCIDAGLGGAEAAAAQALFFILVKEDVVRHDHLHPVGDQQIGFHTGFLQGLDLVHELIQVQGNAVADDVGGVVIKHAGGELMQCKAAIFVDNGVACVAAALKTDDHIGVLRQNVGDLTLSFIAPVGAYDRTYHAKTSKTVKTAKYGRKRPASAVNLF